MLVWETFSPPVPLRNVCLNTSLSYPSQDTFHNAHIQTVTSTDVSTSATHLHPSHIPFKGELITAHKFTPRLFPFLCGLTTCHHRLPFPQPGVMGTSGTGMLPAHPSPAPQTLPPPQPLYLHGLGGLFWHRQGHWHWDVQF